MVSIADVVGFFKEMKKDNFADTMTGGFPKGYQSSAKTSLQMIMPIFRVVGPIMINLARLIAILLWGTAVFQIIKLWL